MSLSAAVHLALQNSAVHENGRGKHPRLQHSKSHAELREQVLALGPARPTATTAWYLVDGIRPSTGMMLADLTSVCIDRTAGLASSAHRWPTLSSAPLMRTGVKAHLTTTGSRRVLHAEPCSASGLTSHQHSSKKQQIKLCVARELSMWVLARVRRVSPQGCGSTYSEAHRIRF